MVYSGVVFSDFQECIIQIVYHTNLSLVHVLYNTDIFYAQYTIFEFLTFLRKVIICNFDVIINFERSLKI